LLNKKNTTDYTSNRNALLPNVLIVQDIVSLDSVFNKNTNSSEFYKFKNKLYYFAENTVKLKVKLFEDKRAVKTFELSGNKDNVSGLVDELMIKIKEVIK